MPQTPQTIVLAIITNFIGLCKKYRRDIFLYACMLLVGGIGYNLGRMNALQPPAGVEIQAADAAGASAAIQSATATPKPTDQRVVASKASKSMLYHYTYCPGASQIKGSNKLWFDNAAAAEAAGYTLAGNCTP